jgi:hypothetical protein
MSGPLATLSDSGGNIGRVDARRLCSTDCRRQYLYLCASKASKLSTLQHRLPRRREHLVDAGQSHDPFAAFENDFVLCVH